jgi:hypothetical protein
MDVGEGGSASEKTGSEARGVGLRVGFFILLKLICLEALVYNSYCVNNDSSEIIYETTTFGENPSIIIRDESITAEDSSPLQYIFRPHSFLSCDSQLVTSKFD